MVLLPNVYIYIWSLIILHKEKDFCMFRVGLYMRKTELQGTNIITITSKFCFYREQFTQLCGLTWGAIFLATWCDPIGSFI